MATTHYDVAHAWVHNQDKAHNLSGNLWHDYGCLHSYSTCIGQRIELDGKIIFLLNTHSYSNTTRHHQSYMESAVPKGDNIHVFKFDVGYTTRFCTDSNFIYDCRRYDPEGWQRRLIRFGLDFLAADYGNCKDISTCRRLEHDFSRHGYEEMCRWFSVTGCTTVPKLLKMRQDDYLSYTKVPRSFLKAMASNTPLNEICDLVNGSGSWADYLHRIEGQLSAKRNREWSMKLGFRTPQNKYLSYSWGRSPNAGRLNIVPVVDGSITKKQVDSHRKSGDLIQWMLSLRKENHAVNLKAAERKARNERQELAKYRLERHIGLCGFASRWNPFRGNDRPYFTRFNYNGTVINFAGTRGYNERGLTEAEYNQFTQMSSEEQQVFIHAKRQWMLEQLQHDADQQALRDATLAADRAEREEYLRLLSEKREYIETLKAQGDEGYRQLYHEGLPISLPYTNASVFYGGNVLLRFNERRNLIETSKSIRLTIDEARRLWLFVSLCHKNGGENAKGMKIHTTDTDYSVHSYQNDILTAGCHQIAYPEMEYMARRLNFIAI